MNALALSLKLTVLAASKELKKRRLAGIYDVPATPSASSSSPSHAYPSSMKPIHEPVAGPSSSNFAQSMYPVKHERSLSPSLAPLAADMGLDFNSGDFDCSFDGTPQLAASNVDSWQQQQQQYQGQNFGDAMDPMDFLLSDQGAGQYINTPIDWSFAGAPEPACAPQPAMDWNMQNWAQSLAAPPLDPNMGLGMGMGMCAPNLLAYDTPSLPSADPLYGQTPSWSDSYFDGFSSDGSSIASSPSAHGLDYLDDFMRRTA